jgi:hypothetical protein
MRGTRFLLASKGKGGTTGLCLHACTLQMQTENHLTTSHLAQYLTEKRSQNQQA